MKYKQLTMAQRYQIEALKKEGLSQRTIANNICVYHSTISRELKEIYPTEPTKSFLLKPIQAHALTITSDNGKEFSYHEKVTKALDSEFYFTNSYQSWQRGLDEHTNGLIREYFQKKMLFKDITDEQIVDVQSKLNRRPKKYSIIKLQQKYFSIQLQNLM